MKHQALFSSKIKVKILKCSLLQLLFGALRVKEWLEVSAYIYDIFCIFSIAEILS